MTTAGKMCGRCGLVIEPPMPHERRTRCKACGGGLFWALGLPPELWPPGSHAPVTAGSRWNAELTEAHWGFRPREGEDRERRADA